MIVDKIKNGLLVAACAFLLQGCAEGAKSEKTGKTETETSAKVEAEKSSEETQEDAVPQTSHVFGKFDCHVKLPSTLSQVSIKKYDALIANRRSSIKRRCAPLADIKRLKDHTVLLVDKENLETVILLEERSSVLKIEKKNAGKLLGLLESQLKQLYPGGEFESIETQYKEGDDSRYCLGKYKIKYGGNSFFQTSYFISNDKRTVIAHVNAVDGDDYEKYLNKVRLK